MRPEQTFLTARWLDLVMLNFRANPAMLAPFVPPGTELDFHQGQTYVSVVGFSFCQSRLLGLRIPGYQWFEEVNLRLYVRRRAASGLRRGVVFVREIVSRRAVAWLANLIYNENYLIRPMDHTFGRNGPTPYLAGRQTSIKQPQHAPQDDLADPTPLLRVDRVAPARENNVVPTTRNNQEYIEYTWSDAGRWGRVGARCVGPWRLPPPGSLNQFIVEHYWGYGRDRRGRTLEYRVDHPPWRVALAEEVIWECDPEAVYGRPWADILGQPPIGVLVADGSFVTLSRAERLEPGDKIRESQRRAVTRPKRARPPVRA